MFRNKDASACTVIHIFTIDTHTHAHAHTCRHTYICARKLILHVCTFTFTHTHVDTRVFSCISCLGLRGKNGNWLPYPHCRLCTHSCERTSHKARTFRKQHAHQQRAKLCAKKHLLGSDDKKRGKFFLSKHICFFLCVFPIPRSDWMAKAPESAVINIRLRLGRLMEMPCSHMWYLCMPAQCIAEHCAVHLFWVRAHPRGPCKSCARPRACTCGVLPGGGGTRARAARENMEFHFRICLHHDRAEGGLRSQTHDGVWRQHLRISGAARVCTLHNSSQPKFRQISNINYPAKDWFV